MIIWFPAGLCLHVTLYCVETDRKYGRQQNMICKIPSPEAEESIIIQVEVDRWRLFDNILQMRHTNQISIKNNETIPKYLICYCSTFHKLPKLQCRSFKTLASVCLTAPKVTACHTAVSEYMQAWTNMEDKAENYLYEDLNDLLLVSICDSWCYSLWWNFLHVCGQNNMLIAEPWCSTRLILKNCPNSSANEI